jgi:hypothetical protein
MGRTLGTMITSTTYGTWLRGDRRGWIDDGKLMPALHWLVANDRTRMAHEPYLFPHDRLHAIGQMIGDSLIERLGVPIFALHVGTWHVHLVVGATTHHIADVTCCMKDAVRYGLRAGRPIWTADYDKRFCFDEQSLASRIRYVERHNEAMGWPARPWDFIACPNAADGDRRVGECLPRYTRRTLAPGDSPGAK